jgi:hypothetical protein
MRRPAGFQSFLLILALLFAAVPARAQTCAPPIMNGVTKTTKVYLSVVPQTAWRPRAGEVWFQLASPTPFDQIMVCFAWPDSTIVLPSPLVRRLAPSEAPVTDVNTVTYAAVVPDMPDAAYEWWDRIWTHINTATGFGTVPEALMVVQAGSDKTAVTLVQKVGVTSVIGAAVLVIVLLSAAYLLLWAVAQAREPGAGARWGGSLLWLITGGDGFASLSQFQIVLWTVTVATCAVYVMALSGNLIELPAGVLVLLGIASGAALVARLPSKVDDRAPRPAMVHAQWSDLVVIGNGIDVTRVQMLIFTLISAAFVIVKVVVAYQIPVIPDNFLLLMGISNGVYLTGRTLPDGGGTKGKTPAPAAGTPAPPATPQA